MKTRRKSKAATAEDGVDALQEPDTEAGSTLNVFVPDDIDIESLENFLPDFPLSNPTPDSIVLLYRHLLAQASEVDATQRDLDDARAEVEKKEVELDQALQDRESLSRESEESLEKTQNELKQVRQERDVLAVSQASLQAQIASLTTSQLTSSSEVDSFRRQVEESEREKRELIGVVSRLKQESTERDDEIQTLRANLKEARQEHQTLESQVRDLRSAETTTNFKLDSLTQQLQLAQAEAQRTSAELVSKSEEFSKYRRTKHAEQTQLQADLDSLTQEHASTTAKLKTLQSGHTAQSHQLNQALSRVQDLTGQLAESQANYTSEVGGLKRLMVMMEEKERVAKEIVDSVENEYASVGERAERREMELRDEVEREKKGREEAEKRTEQLETVLQHMGQGELPLPGRPTTPRRGIADDDVMQGMMGLSPTVAMVSRAQRGGKTFTEVYADYVKLQNEVAHKSVEYERMERTLNDVLRQIEERAPILSHQREEYFRIQSESAQLASQLAQALSDRDAEAANAQDTSQRLKKTTREADLLQKQLSDLGRQVQFLLKRNVRLEDPTIPSDEELEQLPAVPAEDIEAVITNNLVLFRNIDGLQEQNQKLLKIVRELGEKMESEEREYKEAMEKEQGEAVREAHEAIQELVGQLERQKKSSEMTIHAYMKERDALRSMLTRAENAATGRGTREVNGLGEGTTIGDTDLAKELAEVQSQFEMYKSETGVDSVRLREETIAAQREAGHLGAALAKANAKIDYLTERYRMAQDEQLLQSRDLDNLNKRNQKMADQYTRMDIECHRTTEDLLAANSRVEQLRNECANLRAEKNIWEGVQGRLVEENKTLAVERSHLSDLMVNVQKMHADLERSGENDRRRLESQMQMLENQTQDLKTQISQERDIVRHTALQKEIDVKELQGRLDKAMQELSKTRESLVGAETSKKHLEDRVVQIHRQLQGNEEKLAVYERRSSAVNSVAQQMDQDLSHDQQLETEVAELRSALKVAEMDLATAQGHIHQFQEISQANESAFSSLNSTYEEYKLHTEAQIAKNESDRKALEEKFQAVQDELRLSGEKLSELRLTLESERTAWTNDKKTLEDTIVDMSTSEKHSETDRSLRESEARQQEERTKAAEERYSRELLAHADSIKVIENLKRQLGTAQASARDNLASAETAQAKLSTSEASWKQQKDALDKEVADLNARCKDLSSQNGILHQHLESVSSQASRIREAADSTATIAADGETSDDLDTKLSELRSVVAYLRKEKEIVDLQLELSKQENGRLKAQIDHLSQNLDESRAALSEERARALEAASSDQQHAELIERINQLNILRESNSTLRADCETYTKRSHDLDAKLKQLSLELDPAKEQVRIAQAELEARDAQLKRLEDENRRWQERNAQLLSKYDRIDPAEVQALKDEIDVLKRDKANLEKTTSDRDETQTGQMQRIEALEASIRSHREQAQKNTKGFRDRLGQLNSEKSALNTSIADLNNKLKTVTAERDALKSTPAPTNDAPKELAQQLDTLRGEKAAVEAMLAEEKAKSQTTVVPQNESTSVIDSLREERDMLLAEKASWVLKSSDATVTSDSTVDDARRVWEAEKAELVKARDEAVMHANAASEAVTKATEQARNVQLSNEKFQARIQVLQKARASDAERATSSQQSAVAAAVEQTKAGMQTAESSAGDAKRHSNELQALQERLTTQHQQEMKDAVEVAIASAQKSTETSSGTENTAIEAAIKAREAELEQNRAEEIAAAVERGRMEQASKAKLKDGQLVRTQHKLKELEAKIFEWRKAGLLPEDVPPPTPTSSTGGSSSAANPSAAPAAGSAPLPRKPSLLTPATPADGVGRGRGVSRGVRGVQRGLGIRGAAPGRGAPIASPTPATGGVSILGAAAKRSREEGDAADDSLAKRLKPAESGGTAAGTGKPVVLRRDRLPPPT